MERDRLSNNLEKEHNALIHRMVAWSEWEGGFLKPEYLALHESHIGVHADYRMGRYLKAFLDFLAPFKCGLQQVGFFYSYEEGPTASPENCTRSHYFQYAYNVPSSAAAHATAVEEFRHQVTDPIRLDCFGNPPNNLVSVLKTYQYVQPYILTYDPETQKPACLNSITSCVGGDLDFLLNEFKTKGYQFSIYAYRFANSTALHDRTLSMIYRLAFIVHILTWNHDLKTAHAVLKTVHRTASQLDRLRSKLDGTLTELSGELNHIFRTQTQIPFLPCAPFGAVDRGWHTEFPKDDDMHLHGLPDLRRFGEKWRKHVQQDRRLHEYADFARFFALPHGSKSSGEHDGNAAVAAWLLSRELDRTDPGEFGLWADQVCLSLLRGLSFRFSRKIPIVIEYRIEKARAASHKTAVAGLLKTLFCRVPNDFKSTYRWKGQANEGVLQQFVSDGWVRQDEHLGRRPYLRMVNWSDPTTLKRFLDGLTIFAHAVASHETKRSSGWVQLKRVRVHFTIKATDTDQGTVTTMNAWGRAELRVIFTCTDEPQLMDWGSSGTWPRQIHSLASACNQSTLQVYDQELGEGFYATPKTNGYSDWIVRLTGISTVGEQDLGE